MCRRCLRFWRYGSIHFEVPGLLIFSRFGFLQDATNPNLRTELQDIYDLIMKYRLKNSNKCGSATVQDIQKDCADPKEYSAVALFGSEKNSADVSESSEENCRTDRLTKSLSNQRTEENVGSCHKYIIFFY